MNRYYVVLTDHSDRKGCVQIWAEDASAAEALAYAMIHGTYTGIEGVYDARTWDPCRLDELEQLP